jgi:hypothetical protein
MINNSLTDSTLARINPEDPTAINYYSDYFNCSPRELEEAIKKIGNCVS